MSEAAPETPSWAARITAYLAGWNVGVLIFFLVAIGSLELLSLVRAEGPGNLGGAISGVLGLAAAIFAGIWVGRRAKSFFGKFTGLIIYACMLGMILLTYALFPRPMTYVIF